MDESDSATGTEAQAGPLVSDTELSTAFRNLETLLASHPTPLLPQRLITPILVPLWGLMGYAKSIGRSAWHARAAAILKYQRRARGLRHRSCLILESEQCR